MLHGLINLPRPMARLIAEQPDPGPTLLRDPLDQLDGPDAGWETQQPNGRRWPMRASAPAGQQEPDWARFGW